MPVGRGDEVGRVDGIGCFGQEVLVGLRRRMTYVAHSLVEVFIIERADLLKLFQQGAHADLRRICRTVLDSFLRQERLRALLLKLLRAAERNPAMRAAYTMQLCWLRFCEREASERDELYKLIQHQWTRRRHRATGAIGGGHGGGGTEAELVRHQLERLQSQQELIHSTMEQMQSSIEMLLPRKKKPR